jgi:hypothetical protein
MHELEISREAAVSDSLATANPVDGGELRWAISETVAEPAADVGEQA